MVKRKNVFEVLALLPEIVYVDRLMQPDLFVICDAPIIAIKKGESGYHPIYTPLSAEHLNEKEKPTLLQIECMVSGSMFGWDVPAADPEFMAEDWAKNGAKRIARRLARAQEKDAFLSDEDRADADARR
jgi:hypothetical protein